MRSDALIPPGRAYIERINMEKVRIQKIIADSGRCSRRKGESLVINNNIEITVLEIRGDQVKIGISAPKEVPVYRKEVYLQIQNENKAALNATDAMEALKNLF